MKDSAKTISIIFLVFSILLLLYIIYRAEFYHSGTKINYYLKYYAFSFILIFCSIGFFFIRDDLKIKIGTVIIAIIFSLYLIEAYLQIREKVLLSNKIKEIEKKTGIKFDNRSRLQIYQDLKKKDSNIVVDIVPINYLNENNQTIFPLSGISNSRTIHCNENGYFPIYQSDRYGFNNPDIEWNKKETEFFLVGDSFTHGNCVNEPHTISGNLRSMLKQGGVLNLGQGGNGPLIEYATLKEYLPITNTKRVLWMYHEGNDLNDMSKELENPILSSYLTDINFSQDIKSKQEEINQKLLVELEQTLRKNKKRHSITNFLILNKLRTFIASPFYEIKYLYGAFTFLQFETFERIIKLSKELSEKNGAEFYFIYTPEYFRYSGSSKNNNKDSNRQEILQIIKNLNIKIIDLHVELFEKQQDVMLLFSSILKRQSHYNELGYKLVAETIFKKIKEYENIK